jgi:NTP pyrophosphatase (non-canonical NTP hydrolase)
MAELMAGASLAELQRYADVHATERGFNHGDVVQEALLLSEEVGELAKALRKYSGHSIDKNSQVGELAHEIADVLWVLTLIANFSGVDMEKAFREKEVINHGRTWS